MWVFLNNAFVSAVQHRADARKLMVRARIPGDLERVFPDLAGHVQRTPNADYLFRLVVPKTRFAKAMRDAVDGINYPNFKDSVDEKWRHDAYMGVWSIMWRQQMAVRESEESLLDFVESDWPEEPEDRDNDDLRDD